MKRHTEADAGEEDAQKESSACILATVDRDYYYSTPAGSGPAYRGGWGFDTGGVPTGGNTTDPGWIRGAGLVGGPSGFIADVDAMFAGNQPNVRLGVGIGTYTLGMHDGRFPGLQGGFGQDLVNGTPGDGTWLMQEGMIDTSGWTQQTYNFEVIPDDVSIRVFDGALDYNQDQMFSDFAAPVDDDVLGASFSFTLIPEPASVCIAAVGVLVLLRRRRG